MTANVPYYRTSSISQEVKEFLELVPKVLDIRKARVLTKVFYFSALLSPISAREWAIYRFVIPNLHAFYNPVWEATREQYSFAMWRQLWSILKRRCLHFVLLNERSKFRIMPVSTRSTAWCISMLTRFVNWKRSSALQSVPMKSTNKSRRIWKNARSCWRCSYIITRRCIFIPYRLVHGCSREMGYVFRVLLSIRNFWSLHHF